MFFLLGQSTAHAGPWLPAPGHFYLELHDSFATTAQGFDATGTRRALSTLRADGDPTATRLYDSQSALYAEIGLATRLAVVVDFVFLRNITMPRSGESARASTGIGDLRAGLRLALLDEEVSCALEAKLGIPTARSDGDQPLGPGDLRGELSLSVGHAWQRVPMFVTGELGARIRSSGTLRGVPVPLTTTAAPVSVDYSSELIYGLEVGYLAWIGDRLRITPRINLEGRHGLAAPKPIFPASTEVDPVQPASVRLLRLGAALGFGLPLGARGPTRVRRGQLELQIAGGAFVWGEGLPAAGEVSLAIGFSR